MRLVKQCSGVLTRFVPMNHIIAAVLLRHKQLLNLHTVNQLIL